MVSGPKNTLSESVMTLFVLKLGIDIKAYNPMTFSLSLSTWDSLQATLKSPDLIPFDRFVEIVRAKELESIGLRH